MWQWVFIGASLVMNVILWIRTRNMVTATREGEKVELRDKNGVIKKNIISE